MSAYLARRLPFFYGWVVIAVAFLTMGIGVNSRTAFSLLYPPILEEFGWERGITAAAFSVGFLAATLITPLIGLMMDRHGPRYVFPFGALLVGSGLTLATFSSEPWHLFVTLGALVVGGSIFMSYIGHSLFLPHWFVRRRGLAIGIAFSGVGVGSILLFPFLQQLIDSVGWREACYVTAVLIVAIIVPLNFLLQRQRPEHLDLRPDGDAAPEPNAAGTTHPDGIVDREWAAVDWTVGRAIRTARFWWIFAAYFGALFAWYAVQVHQTQYLLENGISSGTAAAALGLVATFGIVGQITIGHASDRIGREWAWTIGGSGFVLCYLLLLALPAAPTPGLVYAMVIAQGLLGYGLTSVMGAIPAEIFHGRNYGTIFGALSLGSGLGAAAGSWATGRIYDLHGSYDTAFWLAMALMLFSIVCVWCAAPRKVRLVAGRIGRS